MGMLDPTARPTAEARVVAERETGMLDPTARPTAEARVAAEREMGVLEPTARPIRVLGSGVWVGMGRS